MKNIIVAQSGGPTTAINASLVGVIKGALSSGGYDKVFGSLYGISGVLKEDFIHLEGLGDEELSRIYATPSSYLGSCRYKMPDAHEDPSVYEKIFEILKRYEVAAFFYIGGNDSMDTISKLAEYGSSIGSDIRFAGVPKTIDNDLVNTDHTPGYGSAAKFIVASMLEFAHDTSVYKTPTVTIVEIMGRNAGWLTAAAALARNEYSNIPQLIYLPEVPFSTEGFINDVKEVLKTTDNVVVAVSEGLQDEKGTYLSATKAACDKFGHAQLSGVGKILENLVKLSNDGAGIYARLPIIGKVNATDEYINSVIRFLEDNHVKVQQVNLLPYHDIGKGKYASLDRPYDEASMVKPDKELMEHFKTMFEEHGFTKVLIGG